MRDGMDLDQYLKFRRTLSPASGYQSVQYRQIEFASTHLINLIDQRFRADFSKEIEEGVQFDASFTTNPLNICTGKLRAKIFPPVKNIHITRIWAKYKAPLLRFIKTFKDLNLYSKFQTLPEQAQQDPKLREAMRHYDHTVNIKWVMAHYNTARHYLNQGGKPLDATGGSDWAKYMHPKYQKRVFFPIYGAQKN